MVATLNILIYIFIMKLVWLTGEEYKYCLPQIIWDQFNELAEATECDSHFSKHRSLH